MKRETVYAEIMSVRGLTRHHTIDITVVEVDTYCSASFLDLQEAIAAIVGEPVVLHVEESV
jgi:hypothetical protein